jgi:excisionase family DNA binding protein
VAWQRDGGCTKVRVDAVSFVAYHSTMTNDEANNLQPEPDPLTVGDLISLQQAAEYAGLSRDTLHNYARLGRLRAKKIGWQWLTTRAAVDAYLQSRHLDNIPKKYRDRA